MAEEYLNIPALLDPQDMADYEIPDKLSILTYLSQFYQVFGAQGECLVSLVNLVEILACLNRVWTFTSNAILCPSQDQP